MAKKESSTKNKEKKETAIDITNIEKELDAYLETKKSELTKDIVNKIDEQIEFKVNKRMKEEEKKILRGKNTKIITRDIIIIILLSIIGYFGYCLYKVDYFNIRTKEVKPTEKIEANKKPIENNEPINQDVHDSEYYIKNYGYLIDNITINDASIYELLSNNLTKETISNDLKLKIAYKNLNPSHINLNNNLLTFNASDLQEAAKKVFGDEITLKNELFNYNNTKFMFYNDTYLAFKEEDTKINFIIKIANAKEEENKIIFEVVIAKLNENKLLNLSDEIILEEYNNANILEFQEQLTTSIISFEKINESYVFSNIENHQ